MHFIDRFVKKFIFDKPFIKDPGLSSQLYFQMSNIPI
jgi:hypothetical protein